MNFSNDWAPGSSGSPLSLGTSWKVGARLKNAENVANCHHPGVCQ